MVVLVTVAKTGQQNATGRGVVGALETPRDLQAKAPEVHFLVVEDGERNLLRARRERFRACRLEVAEPQFRAEPAAKALPRPPIDQRARDVGSVVEARIDVLDAIERVDMVVLDVDHEEAGTDPLNRTVFEVAPAHVETRYAALRGEIDLDRIVRVVPVGFVIVLLLIPVGMETVLEGQAETALLRRQAEAREEAVAEIADPGAAARQLGGRVEDAPLRRVVVTRLPVGAAAPEQQVTAGVLQVGVRPGLPVRTRGVGAQPSPRAVEQHVAVALGRREQVAIGRVGRDDVDESDDIRPVEQRRRSARDLDPLGVVRVDRHAVVIRRAGKIARRNTVLDDVHTVAAEAADDRPARPGPEAAVRDARLVLERFPETAGRLDGNVKGVERRHGVERLERRLSPQCRLGGDGHLLAHRRQAEREFDAGRLACGYCHRLLDGGEVLALRRHHALAGRDVRELECPIVGECECARSKDQDDRAIDRFAVFHQSYGAAHCAGFLRLDRRCRNQCDEHNTELQTEARAGGRP